MSENSVQNNQERLLDSESWKIEAEGVIYDVKNHVIKIEVSKQLESTNHLIYLNLVTKENNKYCIEMSSLGFRIVGNEHDSLTVINDTYYETPYSLLNTISPLFHESFGDELLQKLNKEAEKQRNQNDK